MNAQRPATFREFHGQDQATHNLSIAVKSARRQKRQLGHVLLTGPAGLGKTTLGMSVIPNELSTEAQFINCAAIEKPTALTEVLTSIKEGSVIFLDEIHALPIAAREHLLTAMEDGKLSISLETTGGSQVIEVQLPPFTIIAATTRQGLLDGPMRSRFQHKLTLTSYTEDELIEILNWHIEQMPKAGRAAVCISDEAAHMLAQAAKGIARNAVNLLDNAIDTFVARIGMLDLIDIDKACMQATLDRLGFRGGLTAEEYRYVKYLNTATGPTGLKVIAHALDEQPVTVEEIYEPWLVQNGFVLRESSGRKLSERGRALCDDL